jgi:hypothetical protein
MVQAGRGYSHVMCSMFNASQAEILRVTCGQAACLRQHSRCVLDDFGTGGLGGDDGGGIDAFAAWGSRRFKGITWRKIQLVQDILLQVTANSLLVHRFAHVPGIPLLRVFGEDTSTAAELQQWLGGSGSSRVFCCRLAACLTAVRRVSSVAAGLLASAAVAHPAKHVKRHGLRSTSGLRRAMRCCRWTWT